MSGGYLYLILYRGWIVLSQVFENAEMMFYIIVVGVIGMLAEKVLKFFERRLTSWQEKREI